MDIKRLEHDVIKLNIEKLSQESANLKHQMTIYELQNKLLAEKIKTKKQEAMEESKKLRNKKEEIKNTNKEIAEKHKLEGAWGFNPETGTIIQED